MVLQYRITSWCCRGRREGSLPLLLSCTQSAHSFIHSFIRSLIHRPPLCLCTNAVSLPYHRGVPSIYSRHRLPCTETLDDVPHSTRLKDPPISTNRLFSLPSFLSSPSPLPSQRRRHRRRRRRSLIHQSAHGRFLRRRRSTRACRDLIVGRRPRRPRRPRPTGPSRHALTIITTILYTIPAYRGYSISIINSTLSRYTADTSHTLLQPPCNPLAGPSPLTTPNTYS